MPQLNLFKSPQSEKRRQNLKPSFMQLPGIIDFEKFRHELQKALAYKQNQDGRGRPPFDCVVMWKVIVLQAFYDCSDDQMEFMLRDRRSFTEFVGLHPNSEVPDAKSIWLFKNKLAKASYLEPLFNEVLRQIEAKGMIAQGGQIMDATILESRKPRVVKNPEEIATLPPAKRSQTDADATFTKKHNKTYHGYKGHISIDVKHKIVRKLVVTTASTHDSQVFDQLLDSNNTKKEVHADSAYKSKENDAKLTDKCISNRIVRRAYKNRPLNKRSLRFNKTSAKVRCGIEHVFGAVKQWGRKIQVRSIGITKAEFLIGLRFIVYNMQQLRRFHGLAAA